MRRTLPDPVHPVTAGLHIEDYDRYRGCRPADLAEGDTYLAIHAYSLYTKWARTPLDPAVVAFSVALARALGHAPVMAEEFGINTSPDGKTRSTATGLLIVGLAV